MTILIIRKGRNNDYLFIRKSVDKKKRSDGPIPERSGRRDWMIIIYIEQLLKRKEQIQWVGHWNLDKSKSVKKYWLVHINIYNKEWTGLYFEYRPRKYLFQHYLWIFFVYIQLNLTHTWQKTLSFHKNYLYLQWKGGENKNNTPV